MARKRQFVDWIPGAFSAWPRHGAIQLTQLTRDSRYVVLTRNVPRMSIFVNDQTAIGVQWLRARVSHTCAAIITRSRAIWQKRSSLTNDSHDPATGILSFLCNVNLFNDWLDSWCEFRFGAWNEGVRDVWDKDGIETSA